MVFPGEDSGRPLTVPIDVTVNKFIHVKVWKPRISPVKFKIEGGAAGNLEIFSMNPQTLMGEWEEMVFDFSSKTGTYPIVDLMPDFEDPLTLTEDIVLYFDEITQNNDPTPGSAPVNVIEDYEMIPMNLMLGDPSHGFKQNGDRTESRCGRDQQKQLGGSVLTATRMVFPWGGFWSASAGAHRSTVNKYIHAKVWKPRISPIKFKIEGGAARKPGNILHPAARQHRTWEDMVFDFSSKTGTYPTITFMPDLKTRWP